MSMTPTLKITQQPVSVTVAKGAVAKVTVKAEGEGLTYRWYFKNPTTSNFSLTSTFKGSSYSVTMDASRSGRQVYCVITDVNGNSVQSEVATLNMKAGIEITLQPTNAAAAKDQTVSVFVMAKGENLHYQWYYAAAGSAKFSKASITGQYYSVPMTDARDGRRIYCLITDSQGNSIKTDTVTLTLDKEIKTALKLKTKPVDITVADGVKATVKISVDGEGVKYQWYVLTVGKEDFTKSSNTTSTYGTIMNSSRNGNQVFCVITDSHGNTLVTDTVTLRMK